MHGPTEKRDVDNSEKSSEEGEHSYYYDDSHGYEDFDPKDEETDEELDEQI